MIGENTQILKRQLVTIYLLNFWSNLVFSYTVPYNPLHKSQDYFFFVIAPVAGIVLALLITRRKYRLHRRYIIGFSLGSFCLANSILSISESNPNPSSHVAILILSKIFIGIGWSASTYLTITLLSWLYSGIFPALFAILQLFGIFGYASGTLIASGNYSSKSIYLAFAVVSGVLGPILYNTSGDLSYRLTAERYTLLDYLRNSKLCGNACFLGYLLFCKAFVVYGIYFNLERITKNYDVRVFGGLLEAIGGIFALILSIFFNFRLERGNFILFSSLFYAITFIFIGPWKIILSPTLWLILIALFINGFLLQFLIVNLVTKIFHYSTSLYSYQFDALLCECLGSAFTLASSISLLIGPIFGLIFSQFTDFSTTSTIIGLILIISSVFYYKTNKVSILSANVVETEPVQIEPISKSKEISLDAISNNSEPVPEPISEKSLNEILNRQSGNYEYNFLGIQTGYFSGEEFPSIPSNKDPSSSIKVSMNHSLPLQKLKQVGDTIIEQKNEESSSDKPENSKQSEYTEESKGENNQTEDNLKEDKKVEIKDKKNKYKTQPPIFKEQKIQIEVEATVSLDNQKVSLSSSYHKSQDVIKDLSGLFPENPYDTSNN